MSEAELLECLYRVGDDKYQGKGCAWMAWRLVGQAQPPNVGHHVVLRPERGANLWVFFHKHHEAAAPSSGVHLYKLGKGKLHDVVKLMANCLEQKGTMRAMSRGEYDGLVAANEPPAPEFSPRRVLKNYGDMTTSEFQSHLIKLDTTFRGDKALNTGKRPPNTEDEFVHLQSRALMQLRKQLQDDQLQTESLLVSRHRQLLMTDFVINESTVNCWWYNPEVHQKQPLDFFEAYGRAHDERRTLIFYGDSGKGKTPLASCLAAMVARDAGLDEFVMVSSPDMLRSAVERNLLRDERPLLLDEGVDTLKHLLGLSPDLPATIKCRYNDVKVPAETFRIITVQDLAKLHHDLDDMAKIRPPDLMLEGFEWRARPLDKVFDADTRAVLKRCILVEVTVQWPVIRDTGACLLRAQTRQKPDRTRTDRCKPPAPLRTCLAQRRTVGRRAAI